MTDEEKMAELRELRAQYDSREKLISILSDEIEAMSAAIRAHESALETTAERYRLISGDQCDCGILGLAECCNHNPEAMLGVDPK